MSGGPARGSTSVGGAGRAAQLTRASLRILAIATGVVCAAYVALFAHRLPRKPPPEPAGVRYAPPATLASSPAAAFPLKVGPTHRYLVDSNDRPFLIAGDSPQALMVNASPAQAGEFLDNRTHAGFNSVWVNLLCATYTGGRPDGATKDGIRPFWVNGDLSTPNDAYFARADAVVRHAAQDGIAVFLDPIETGSWLEVLRHNGVANAYAYGEYLGRRYRDFPNIVWFNGNDFQTWRNASDDELVQAVSRGIRAAAPHMIQTVEFNYLISASRDNPRWNGMVELNAAYTYSPTYAKVLTEYGRPAPDPVFMVEANYEGEHWYTGPQTLRRQEYWSLLSGAMGQFYGNKYTWPLADGWQKHLDTVGSRQMSYVTNLFSALPWFDLVPDADHRILVGGYGYFNSSGSVNDNDYVTAAATQDGSVTVAYLPRRRTVAIDLSQLRAPLRARWYDPTRGTYVADSHSRLPSGGIQTFTPPGANGDGDDDWVLVLDDAQTAPRPTRMGREPQHPRHTFEAHAHRGRS